MKIFNVILCLSLALCSHLRHQQNYGRWYRNIPVPPQPPRIYFPRLHSDRLSRPFPPTPSALLFERQIQQPLHPRRPFTPSYTETMRRRLAEREQMRREMYQRSLTSMANWRTAPISRTYRPLLYQPQMYQPPIYYPTRYVPNQHTPHPHVYQPREFAPRYVSPAHQTPASFFLSNSRRIVPEAQQVTRQSYQQRHSTSSDNTMRSMPRHQPGTYINRSRQYSYYNR